MNSAGYLLSLGSCIPAHFCAVFSGSGITSPCWVSSNQPQNGSNPPTYQNSDETLLLLQSLFWLLALTISLMLTSLFSKHCITPRNVDNTRVLCVLSSWTCGLYGGSSHSQHRIRSEVSTLRVTLHLVQLCILIVIAQWILVERIDE